MITSRSVRSIALLLALSFAPLGCRAQTVHMTPELARRVLLKIRDRAQLPYNVDIAIVDQKPAKVPGYDQLTIRLTTDDGKTQDLPFLVSADGKSLAQFNTFDISADPASVTSDAGRPARGGPDSAPVHIVIFDDLQCPFCARSHRQLFPAILDRYGDKVHIVYKDFPLGQHHWAIHAAVDGHCLSDGNTPAATEAYWQYVDYVHLHLAEIGAGPELPGPNAEAQQLSRATADVDRIAERIGSENHLGAPALHACIARQDASAVKVSQAEGDHLEIDGVPVLFINGERLVGAVPVEYVWKAIDRALLAKGIPPPPAPAVPAPAPATPPAPAKAP